jgi:Mn-containing catalase
MSVEVRFKVRQRAVESPCRCGSGGGIYTKVIISQIGGPDGELAASLRYLNQRHVMPYAEVKGLLTDIGISLTNLHHYLIFQNQSLFL